LKIKATFLPGEAAVLHSAVSARQPAELALLAVLRPALPACNKRKGKFTLFSDHNGSLLRRQPEAPATIAQHAEWLGAWTACVSCRTRMLFWWAMQ